VTRDWRAVICFALGAIWTAVFLLGGRDE
jgi:hypothetical protein